MAETKINANQTNITASDIGAASTAQLAGKQDIIQYETLPTASADNVDSIVQFVGTTDSTYTNGYFYKCTESSGSYSWVQTDVQPSSGGSSLPDMTGQSGKFLTNDGSSASWSDKPLVNTSTVGTGLKSISVGSDYSATGTGCLNIGMDTKPGSKSACILLGTRMNASGDQAIGIYSGGSTRTLNQGAILISNANSQDTSGAYSVCVGSGTATANGAIQIGAGWNTEQRTMYVGFKRSTSDMGVNYKLLDSDGTIPTDRFTTTPTTDGTYIPSVTVSNGVATRTWDSKEFVAHMAMPSANYDELTFGASGTVYTAPADGYYAIRCENSNLTNHWINITLNGLFIANYWAQVANNSFGLPLIPCQKGGTLKIEYGSGITGSASKIRFIYANGAQ